MHGMRREMKAAYSNLEANTAFREKNEYIPIHGLTLMDDLFVLDETLDHKFVRALEDQGCNTNVVLQEFFERNRTKFN